ncbi:hypothetical protein FXN63_10530 [Pigmentiphaga aceris]|uniref:DUF6933 domain-containing protein n=1 Tax=Pigmentiphaga aceris TaxID=1940612 RepID=A0A5C0AVK2_9BURK|nr:hypothetical protein [Pigmentiphaga aceris]QEI06225.1 hypothetical protein FXN63_10530 [Pigmentiphaga aceris]
MNDAVSYLKCTGEVQKAIGLDKKALAEASPALSPLGHWYVHRFSVGRTKFFLFMSEVSLLSFVLQKSKTPVTTKTLPTLFLLGLSQLLSMKGIDAATIEKTVAPYLSGRFAKTDSRKTLGCMNDLVFQYTAMVEQGGGAASCDLSDVIWRANEIPQRTLGWEKSWVVTQSLIEGTDPVLKSASR